MANQGAPNPTVLFSSEKDNNLFKNISKHFDNKMYKKALKICDTLLAKHPDHGDTLALKGLILKHIDRSDEAYELVKSGLKSTKFTSYLCWQMLGNLYKMDRDYNQAIRCYLQSMRFNKDNFVVLRDLAVLQVHMRDYSGYLESRVKLWEQKTTNRTNWLGLIVAYHLMGNYGMALGALDSFIDTGERKENSFDYSELLLYKALLLMESDKHADALSLLTSKEANTHILDKLNRLEYEGQCLLKLNRLGEALSVYKQLLHLNPDNFAYVRLYVRSKGINVPSDDYLAAARSGVLSTETANLILQTLDELEEQLPKSQAMSRLALDVSTGADFECRLAKFIVRFLRKGASSLFSELKSLYGSRKNPRPAASPAASVDKVQAIENLIIECKRSLKEDGTLGTRFSGLIGATVIEKEPEHVLSWVTYYLAAHYDRMGHFTPALAEIDEAIALSPKVQEMYYLKGRIYKHTGDVQAAAEQLRQASELDLADRYLNTKWTKYELRRNNISEAAKVISRFTKDSVTPVPGKSPEATAAKHLTDMQCIWFEAESGDTHFRKGEWGQALKNYLAIDKHFKDFEEDQMDFHSYCLRKTTLRPYIEMIRFEDRIRGHKFYVRGALSIAKTYMRISEVGPIENKAEKELEEQLKNMSVEDRKKFLSKKRKQEFKQGKKGRKKDDDESDKLVNVENPLFEASKFLHILEKFAPNTMEVHTLGIDLYLRRKKYLLALKAAKKASEFDKEHPDVRSGIVKLFQAIDSDKEISPRIQQIIALERDSF